MEEPVALTTIFLSYARGDDVDPFDPETLFVARLHRDLTAGGFEVMECIPVVGPLGWTTMVRLTCAAVALRRLPIAGPALAGALAVVMNLKAAVEDQITPAWVTKDNACVYVTLSRRARAGTP